MAAKHLLLIHGRATKPRRDEKERLVTESLLHGLDRVDPAAAGRIREGEVKLTFAYYGDINNRIMVEAEPGRREWMESDPDGDWYEKDGSYDDDLKKLFRRKTAAHTPAEYRAVVRKQKDKRFFDEIAGLISPLLAGGLSRRIIKRMLPDLGAYITSRKVGSAVRERLQTPLMRALDGSEDVAIVAHSMGCVASYDVLWKLSHMSEYRAYHDRKVSLWLTLGSPLGEPAVRECLYDSNEPPDGRWPRNIRRWINVAAYDDFVAHDETAADDFRAMASLGCDIQDLPKIHTFWVGTGGLNPHKFYGYLDHPEVARVIAAWVTAPTRAAAGAAGTSVRTHALD